jgi:hypothetical protein
MDKVQIEIIFRPIPQPAAPPGRHPQGEARHAPRPWQQGTGREPAVHGGKPPARTHPPVPSAPPAKPEVPAPSPPSKSPSAPPAGPIQAPNVAGPLAPVEPPSSSSQGTGGTTPGAKATPEP